jgi:hypothetical protein
MSSMCISLLDTFLLMLLGVWLHTRSDALKRFFNSVLIIHVDDVHKVLLPRSRVCPRAVSLTFLGAA